jgi:DNA-binding GntR family transcriptional regulator
VVARAVRMLRLTEDSDIWTPWVDGYREVLELLEKDDRQGATARYRQIYVEHRAAVEKALWPDR